jgi:hypothetical protein
MTAARREPRCGPRVDFGNEMSLGLQPSAPPARHLGEFDAPIEQSLVRSASLPMPLSISELFGEMAKRATAGEKQVHSKLAAIRQGPIHDATSQIV